MPEVTTTYITSLKFSMYPRVGGEIDHKNVVELSACEAVQYEQEILNAIAKSLEDLDPDMHLVDGFLENEEILKRANIEIMRISPSVTVRDSELKGLVTVVSSDEMTRDAESLVLSFVDESFADIWGEGPELQTIETLNGELSVSFWNPTTYIKPVPELEGYDWFPYSIQIEYIRDTTTP